MERTFTLDDICEALAIATDIGTYFIKKEFEEEALPNSDTPVEALAWVIGNCVSEAGTIRFSEGPEEVFES